MFVLSSHSVKASKVCNHSWVYFLIHLKSTVPSEPDGASHINVILGKFVRAPFECATVACVLAPTVSQFRICWLLFWEMNRPSRNWFWLGTWAITRKPRKVLVVLPLRVTTADYHSIYSAVSKEPGCAFGCFNPTCVGLSCCVAVTSRAGARDISSDGVATIARLRSTTMAWRHLVADSGESTRAERRSGGPRLSFGDS